ncbi:MAG: protein-L-isoaspartate(D-aspartate) O-methyltransferase [Planctomycetales bacterium]|nr:protein-L-isoaspartate(D-aspartate) O-methyltransferase [Planctomycetales bacterium]
MQRKTADKQKSVRAESSQFTEQRLRMVRGQLSARGIHDPQVLAAMNRVPREAFVDPMFADEAYDDNPLPIPNGQTVSQPFTVAFMAQALQLTGTERVLEIGTGSGYGAAVLSCLSAEVHTIERIAALAQQAKDRLSRLGFSNVHVHVANGNQGLPDHAPFDAIVVTAGATELPAPYVEQLADGGRIVIPIGELPTSQTMYRFTRSGSKTKTESFGRFAFVPLIGEHGWPEV